MKRTSRRGGEGEDKLRAVVEALPDLLFVLDDRGTYIEALSSSEDLLYAAESQLVGRRMHDVLPRESADLFLATVRRTLSKRKSQILEYSLDVPAGRRFFEGRTSPLDRRRVVWISRDITERKQLEERLRAQVAKTRRAYRELQRAQAQLVRSEKFASMGMLISGVAHELNNPLNVMYGNLKLMAGAPEPERRAGMLSDALRAAERAKAVMDDFRNFARDLRDAEFADLNACVREAVTLASTDLPADVRIVEKLGRIPSVRCLPRQIRQVFQNLIANAVEAVAGKGTITLTTKRTDDGGVLAEVADTGRGMSPQVRKRLFEPFFTTKPVGRGLGLGLSISAMIVHRHDGELTCTSRPGKGTLFRVRLPGSSRAPSRTAGS